MPRTEKVSADARSAFGAAADDRENVHPLMRCTKRELIDLLEGFTTAATSREIAYALSLNAFLDWFTDESKGRPFPEARDRRLVERLEAVRTATTKIRQS